MRHLSPRLFYMLLGALFLLNLLQAFATELIYDESYYWYYAQNVSWGYFDHPPMVAWMIALGGLLFEGELGVRFISCLMGVGTLWLLWKMIRFKKAAISVWVCFIWLISIPLLHAYGFLSLPDTPLLFFTALFLYQYRNFLHRPDTVNAVLLGLVMAGLMYSKYHAALVIIFLLLSNLKLLKDPKAWIALAVSLLCYTPHLWWLVEQDLVSIKYHLFDRPNQAYSFTKFTAGYFLNLITLFGLTFPLAYWALYRFPGKDPFNRALKFITYGILIFFFASSFQRRVQTQWLIVICIPMALMVVYYAMDHKKFRKWLFRLSVANVLILLFLRAGLVYEPLFPVRYESHGNKKWVASLEEVVGEHPVVFENSYRLASMYAFYSGNRSFSLNNIYYRKNQYSIDDSEQGVQGQRIFYVPKSRAERPLYYVDGKGRKRYGYFVDSFRSYRQIQAGVEPEHTLQAGQTARMWLYNPYPFDIPLEELKFGVAFLDRYKKVKEFVAVAPSPGDPGKAVLQSRDSTYFSFVFPETKIKDATYFRASLARENLYWGLNGANQKIEK
ncbi:ArnT family glycosyltransferase [Robiginitalea sp. IMCC43444]|uniref:ArnT family glycosyltransferase n=1 Tax=Robiginitalea sp. IMCC43444 TaxID=3459121 RepID=UPI004041B25D